MEIYTRKGDKPAATCKGMGFQFVPVFDVSQTESEKLPSC